MKYSIFDAFITIYERICNSTKPLFSAVKNEMKIIASRYNLTPASIVVVAFLLHYYPKRVYTSALEPYLSQWGDDGTPVLSELVIRGYVKAFKDDSSNRICYVLCDEAVEAFFEGRTFEEKVFLNCFDELITCDEKCLSEVKWLRRFEKSFSLSYNAQFAELDSKYQISSQPRNIQSAFWKSARHFALNFTAPFYDDSILTQSMVQLINIGAVAKVEGEDSLSERMFPHDWYILAPGAVQILFSGHDEIINYDNIATYTTIISNKTIAKKELYFSYDTQVEMDKLQKMLSKDGYKQAAAILKRKKRNIAIQSLLWGPPGTGKTESVKQLALKSGRDIILFDSSKTISKWLGGSEKNFRAVFSEYNYIASVSSNVPILLLNEADSILSRRIEGNFSSVGKTENNVSNILLQAFEDMHGILLATTNLVDNLDPAFGRRFLFKTQILKPDAEARAKIWLASIAELKKNEAKILADNYEMSGAQIDNVVTKRDLAELYYEGDRGLSYIKKLCEEELESENGSRSKRARIGF